MPEVRHPDGASTHPDDETFAAFVDGTLRVGERQQVETHLAECEDCRELVAEVLHTNDESRSDAPQTPRKAFWTRMPVVAAGGAVLAAAAALVIFVSNARSPLTTLVSVVGEERLTTARPTGGFKYGSMRPVMRGGSTDANALYLRAEAEKLRERAAATGAAKDVHAWGVAQMLTGDTAASVTTLNAARTASPSEASFEADYGAALFMLFLETRQPDDANRALASLTRATALEPGLEEAVFNKALLLEALDRYPEALQAWATYLELDGQSRWSDEARRRMDALRTRPTGR